MKLRFAPRSSLSPRRVPDAERKGGTVQSALAPRDSIRCRVPAPDESRTGEVRGAPARTARPQSRQFLNRRFPMWPRSSGWRARFARPSSRRCCLPPDPGRRPGARFQPARGTAAPRDQWRVQPGVVRLPSIGQADPRRSNIKHPDFRKITDMGNSATFIPSWLRWSWRADFLTRMLRRRSGRS